MMENLDYNELVREIEKDLEEAEEIVLATCAGGIVTGRTMNHVNDGLTVMFGTSKSSTKARQMRVNPNIALVCGSVQIEATAELGGHPLKNAVYVQKNEQKFPWMKDAFPTDPNSDDDSVLVICRPRKITCYKFINGNAHWDVLEAEEGKAYRL